MNTESEWVKRLGPDASRHRRNYIRSLVVFAGFFFAEAIWMVIGYNVTTGTDRNVAAIVVLAVGLACFITVYSVQAHYQRVAVRSGSTALHLDARRDHRGPAATARLDLNGNQASEDPYLLTNGTFRNRLGITDKVRLAIAEAERVVARSLTLDEITFPESFGFSRLSLIHHHLFQDLYDWAETCPATAGGESFAKSPPRTIWGFRA